MNNREIAKQFDLLANLMELHDENPFKIRSYNSAYNVLRKLESPLSAMDHKDIESIPGIGKSNLEKIVELLSTGQIKILKKYKDMTPVGVIELLSIRGLGPKKIRTIWQQLDITSPGDLLYACNENRLIEASGFGTKSQEDIRIKLEYYLASQGYIQLGYIIDEANDFLTMIKNRYPNDLFDWVGDLGKKMQIVHGLEVLCTNADFLNNTDLKIEVDEETGLPIFKGQTLSAIIVPKDEFGKELVRLTSSQVFFEALGENAQNINAESDSSFFHALGKTFIPAEVREEIMYAQLANNNRPLDLIGEDDIKGVIHAHSTYSDGINTIASMAQACIDKGYEYLVITDHSQSAGYAGGLKIDRLEQQWEEIDKLNSQFSNFKIVKGIESDILGNGDLDYPQNVLEQFEIIIASIHSAMSMTEEKATERLISAIKNPYTHILGHPTGRLLLGRPGYPINHPKIIEACAEYNVAIELNANPQRLDLDYKWIKLAMDSGVKIGINPDAHSTGQIDYIRFGIIAARKGGLTSAFCLNSLTREELLGMKKI